MYKLWQITASHTSGHLHLSSYRVIYYMLEVKVSHTLLVKCVTTSTATLNMLTTLTHTLNYSKCPI